MGKPFEPLTQLLCDAEHWPHAAFKTPPPQLGDACKNYEAMVGRVLAGNYPF